MKKYIIIGSLLLLAVNCLLIHADDDGKIERYSYASDWELTGKKDMEETLDKKGLITAEEHNIYTSEHTEAFQEFLVEKGDKVSAGDHLYTFKVGNFYETRNALTNDMEVLKEEIQSLEMLIQEVQAFQIPSSGNQSNFFSINEGEFMLDIMEGEEESIQSEWQKEQFLMEAERELRDKESKFTQLENQLNELNQTGDQITFASPYSGTIKEISTSLDDPLITILGTKLQVATEVTEIERDKVAEQMEGRVDYHSRAEVVKVSDIPEKMELHQESVYPVTLEFTEEEVDEEFLPGNHVDVELITEQSSAADVVKEKFIKNNHITVVQENGVLRKQIIDRGIKMGIWVEVEDLEEPVYVAYLPFEKYQPHSILTMPIKIDTWRTKEVIQAQKKKPFTMGLMMR